jgi:hypothetical protein
MTLFITSELISPRLKGVLLLSQPEHTTVRARKEEQEKGIKERNRWKRR